MGSITKEFNKLSLPSTILIATIVLGSVFLATQIIKQRSIERQQQVKIEQEKQDKLDKELKAQEDKEEAERKKEESELELDDCINDAEQRYSVNWHGECKARGKLSARCIALHEMTMNDYLEDAGLDKDADIDALLKAPDDFYNEKSDCLCMLPTTIANKLEESRDNLKDICFKKYPQKWNVN